KESSGIMQRVTDIQRLCGDQIEVLCGCDTLPLEMFLMGVEGWVAAPANIVPRQCVRLFDLAVVQKDIPAARSLYNALLALFTLFEESGQYVQLSKAALEMLGRPVGKPRPTLVPVSGAALETLRECIQTIYQMG